MYKYEQYGGLHAPKSTMDALSSAELDKVLVLIDSGHSAHQTSSPTGHHYSTVTQIWSKHHPHVSKPSGDHPSKLSPTVICHAICLIHSERLKMPHMLPIPFNPLPISPSLVKPFKSTSEGWFECCGEEEMPHALLKINTHSFHFIILFII